MTAPHASEIINGYLDRNADPTGRILGIVAARGKGWSGKSRGWVQLPS